MEPTNPNKLISLLQQNIKTTPDGYIKLNGKISISNMDNIIKCLYAHERILEDLHNLTKKYIKEDNPESTAGINKAINIIEKYVKFDM